MNENKPKIYRMGKLVKTTHVGNVNPSKLVERDLRIAEIVEILSDGEWHTGDDIAKRIKVTSNVTVCMLVKNIQGVYRVTGKGYRMCCK